MTPHPQEQFLLFMRTIFELFSKLAELQLVLPRKSLLKILLDSASLPSKKAL